MVGFISAWLQGLEQYDQGTYWHSVRTAKYLVQLTDVLEKKLRQGGRWEWAIEESRLSPEIFDESPAPHSEQNFITAPDHIDVPP